MKSLLPYTGFAVAVYADPRLQVGACQFDQVVAETLVYDGVGGYCQVDARTAL